jgi:hypothetical protein
LDTGGNVIIRAELPPFSFCLETSLLKAVDTKCAFLDHSFRTRGRTFNISWPNNLVRIKIFL